MKVYQVSNGDHLPEGTAHWILSQGSGQFRIRGAMIDECASFSGRIIQGPLRIPAFANIIADPGVTLYVCIEERIGHGGIYREFDASLSEWPLLESYIARIDLISPTAVIARNIYSIDVGHGPVMNTDSQNAQGPFQAAFPRGLASGLSENRSLSFPFHFNAKNCHIKTKETSHQTGQRVGALLLAQPGEKSQTPYYTLGAEIIAGNSILSLPKGTKSIDHLRFNLPADCRFQLSAIGGQFRKSVITSSQEIDMSLPLGGIKAKFSEFGISLSADAYLEVGLHI